MDKECVTFNGNQLTYLLRKGESDLWIVFVHGAGGDSSLFEKQFQGLDKKWNLLAPDLPGHGGSAPVPDATVGTYRDVIIALARSLGIQRAVLAGHSMGGGVIIEAQRAVSDMVAGMVFIACGPALPVAPVIFDLIEKNFAGFAAMAGEFMCGKDADEHLKSLLQNGLDRAGKDQTYRDFSICRRYDYLPVLGDISVPALVLANTGDRLVSVKGAKKLHEAIASSVLKIYEGSSHMPHWELAESANRDIDELCASLAK
ncbi:MAG TPA: alpha/beta hydrolase [Spirochaetota bacterium]|nr:alpha/beta hydrolase [Spirochaetota bacterium]HPI90193.1 alpha/beta hydrolase [Spirochaetota bacterium]HPR46344.1 alpha/beta hydrolase [Spirochaetota bacterium]